MGFTSVEWSAFSWEAFATLTTGFLAVGGAIAVGLRQTRILERQTTLQEQSVRSDIFDRRYKVFERVERFLLEICQSADDPTKETERDFLISMGEARFLFSETVVAGLQETWEKSSDFHALKRVMDHTYKTKGHYGEGTPEQERLSLVWFSDRLRTLSVLFAEMRLGGTMDGNAIKRT